MLIVSVAPELPDSHASPTDKKSVREPASMNVAVSAAIFAVRPDPQGNLSLWLPLVRRTRAPFEDAWALPGGWVGSVESLENAAARTLRETTGLTPSYLEQLYTFGLPDRSPVDVDGRVISVVYTALVRNHEAAQATEDDNVRWFEIGALPTLAFDHAEIVSYALWRLRNKANYAHVAFYFLPERFVLSELREIYEAILGRSLDPANFRRRVEASGLIVSTKERVRGGRHRPPLLYKLAGPVDPESTGPAA